MKLNPDCVRDILLGIENACVVDMHAYFRFDNSPPLPQCVEIKLQDKYSPEEIAYHLRQCDLSGFLFKCNRAIGITTVCDLSPAGHEFLANIRANTIWNKTKTIAEKVGTASLGAFVQISSNVITEIIKAEFGLSP